MGPAVVRSSLEVMLDSLRKKDQNPEDSMPTLPARPVSKGRLPSFRRSLTANFSIESNGFNNEQKKMAAPKAVVFGGRKIVNVEQPDESPYSEMPELESLRERRPDEVGGSESSTSRSILPRTEDGEKLVHVLRKDTTKDQSQGHYAVVEDFQRQVLKAETELRIKEHENLTLKQQIQQYETKWADYEAKMKSMEEMWQKQLTSLQMSLAAARKSLAADDKQSQTGRHATSPNNHCFDSEYAMSVEFQTPQGTPAKQPRAPAAIQPILPGDSDGTQNTVSHTVKEFEQQNKVLEENARFLIGVKPGQSHSSVNTDGELQKLKVRFTSWKKDYKVKLRETKVELQKHGNSETARTRKKWWWIGPLKKMI